MDFKTAEEAVAVLRDGDRDEGERIEAAQALGTMGNAGSIGPMFHTLESAETGLSLALAEALRQLNVGALLSRDLKFGTVQKRRLAALGFVRIQDPRSLDALTGATGDEDDEVRSQVYQALGRLEGPRVLEALIGGLKDAFPEARAMAAYGIGQLKDDSNAGVAALEAALEEEADDVARVYFEKALKRLRKT